MRFIRFQDMSIVITGNPGVGKHTIAHEIAKKLKLSILDINNLAKEKGLFEKIDDVVEIDVLKLEKIIKKEKIRDKIIVGHLAPYILEKNEVKTVIVLRRNPYDLVSVYKERKYTDKKSKENISSEILGIIANDAINRFYEKTFQVNIVEQNIQKTTQKVMKVINTGKGNEAIDWLEMVKKNNDLREFFSD